ncbi:hypothetical protein DK926_18775 [Rhodococcus sp. Eu-32]|uniref:hypothetical protein n=1 Tax=Rhodococcus sp. Eu-32 TaxID=1017319 RepID=UPI000DF36767|nr:hypothetical protein [Rhodococcus sp. Eu-32]RRQ26292.1 hypothetical protein DK926_18775 [Rhodococcus sp. Eu-32]
MTDNAIGTVLDMGAPEPADNVIAVESIEFDDIDEYDSGVALTFGRTRNSNEWKGYLFGGKVYYRWDELVRRFGPVRISALAAVPAAGEES